MITSLNGFMSEGRSDRAYIVEWVQDTIELMCEYWIDEDAFRGHLMKRYERGVADALISGISLDDLDGMYRDGDAVAVTLVDSFRELTSYANEYLRPYGVPVIDFLS